MRPDRKRTIELRAAGQRLLTETRQSAAAMSLLHADATIATRPSLP